HQDGRCATVAETIFVKNDGATCSDNVSTLSPGTVGTPLCTMQPVVMLLSATRDLVVVRGTVQGATWTFAGQGADETSFVGEASALLAGGASPGFAMIN